MPYITSQLGEGTAPAPSKARTVCVARLKLLGDTSSLTSRHVAGGLLMAAIVLTGPSCSLARAKALSQLESSFTHALLATSLFFVLLLNENNRNLFRLKG